MFLKLQEGDCLQLMREMEDDSVDLVFTSPPYEDNRTYGIDFKLKGQDWVDWACVRFQECLRICKGLVAWVVEGKTRNYRYSCVPQLMIADLHRAGVNFRKPPVFHRVGISGSGGPDWLRNDWEHIICATKPGRLPWSDNTACGHTPKWAPGGEMSHRLSSGARVNQWGHPINSGATVVDKEGVVRSKGRRPSHREAVLPQDTSNVDQADRTCTHREPDGTWRTYNAPVLANPGNVLKFNVGGGLMGSKLAHENEAPFPEGLADFFVRSFCPPGGTVLDPFCGSGTTGAAAIKTNRSFIGLDIRASQIELSTRRIQEALVDSDFIVTFSKCPAIDYDQHLAEKPNPLASVTPAA